MPKLLRNCGFRYRSLSALVTVNLDPAREPQEISALFLRPGTSLVAASSPDRIFASLESTQSAERPPWLVLHLYSVYEAFGVQGLNTLAPNRVKLSPVNALFIVFNLWSISQAGRRGFESRLPLQNQQLTGTSKNAPSIALH